MGSILHFFDLNQGRSSRKVVAHKKQIDGHEAPRNSLEFSMETSHNYDIIQDDIPYSCEVKQNPSKMSYRSNDASLKRLIDDEMSKRVNDKRSSPSVVARLMGMDSLPSETKPIIHVYGRKEEKPKRSWPRKEATRVGSGHHAYSLHSSSMKSTKQDLMPRDIKKKPIQSTDNLKVARPQPREHPQEEVLQKFKMEFEAWQTSKVWETSRAHEANDVFRQVKVNQIIAQENLNKEKMARYWESRKHASYEMIPEQKVYVSTSQSKTIGEHGIFLPPQSHRNKQLTVTKFNEKHDSPPSPTRIVILRPTMEIGDDAEASWLGSPELLEKEASMQDFLEEVKERLKSEILGKTTKSNTAQGFTEGSGDTKQYAQHIAKHIGENVTRDLGTSLVRSESARSYRSEIRLDGPEFPESVNQNTRKLLSERLKNVIRNETDVEIPLATGGRSRRMQEKVKSRSLHDFSRLVKESSPWEHKRSPMELKATRDGVNDSLFDPEPTSPRNLVRSFSAPVSGTAFAKLLLQDQHVLTGAHIHRKHEVSESSSPELRRRKKDSFNLKGTVSTLRQNLTLKGKLFGKKTHSIDESAQNEFDSSALATSPSIIMKVGGLQDNSTEVPPSPASVSSSSLDEFCRPGVPSPVSPLPGLFIEDHFVADVIKETCSILPEPRDSSQDIEHRGFDTVAVEESYEADAFEAEGHARAYIRDILIAIGLYEGESFDEPFPKWDASKTPIPKWVFDEVEASYKDKGKLVEAGELFSYGDANASHKLLFDLTNEALPTVLKAKAYSTFNKRVLNTALCREKLLDAMWSQVQAYLNHPLNESNSVDCMVAQDARQDPWCTVLHEDLYVTGRKIELAILEDLIDEFMLEMLISRVHGLRS